MALSEDKSFGDGTAMQLRDSRRRKLKRKRVVTNIKRDTQTTKRKKTIDQQANEKRAEKALEESEALYHTLFENTGTAMLVIDENTTVLTVNTEFERISGYSKKEIEGKRSWTEFVAKGYLEKMKEYHDLRRIDPKAAPRTYESKLIDRQGKVVDALLTVALIPGTKKSIVSFIDITEHKEAEKELENLAKYPADNPSPILRLDKNGIILHANKASDTLLKDWRKKIGDYAPKFWSDHVAEAYRSKSSKSAEVDCGKITYLFNVVPVVDSGYVNLYGRDITERKRMEEGVEFERRRLFSLLDELPGVIALFARDHSIRFSNRYFRERFGDPEGRFCYEILHNCKEPCEPCPSFHVFNTGKPEAWESERSDGHSYMTYDYPFSDADGSQMVLEVSYDITERKRLENDLRKSEERLAQVAENAGEWIWEVDAEGLYTYSSPAVEKMLGFRPEEIVRKKHFFDLFAPDVRQDLTKAAFDSFAKRELFRKLVNPNVHKNGSIVILETSGTPIVNERGELVGYRGADTDITERKRLENDLRKSEERFRIAAQCSSDLVNEWNIVIGVVSWFGDVDKKLGYAPGEFPRTIDAWERALHPDDHDHVMAAVERHFKTGEPCSQEYRIRRKDGSYCYWIERGVALRDDKGNLARWIGACTDVTQRREMEEELKRYSEDLKGLVEERTGELRESEARYRAVVENQTELIVRVKPDWTLTFVNDAYCRFVDKKREELIGQNAAQFVLDEDIQKGKKTHATLSPQNPVTAYQERNVVAGGEIRWTEWRDRGIFDEQGNLVEIQSVARDITERKQAEEKLRNAERYMGIGQAAAMVGHDLRNPLQIIVNRLYLAKRAVKNLSSPYSEVAAKLGLEELFAELQYQASYMNKIVSDVQDYAKITHPEALETSLPKLLDDTFSTIDIPANVRVSREIDKDFPKLLIDPHLIRRALTNLIRNGIQAMPNGGQLIITASKTESNALISVQDTGVGIPQENLNKLFTPLFTSKAKGTGLGLPVSKRLVEAHGGSITVESKVGEGSIFTVKLPLNGEVEETHPNH